MLQFSCCNCTGFQVNIQLLTNHPFRYACCNCTGFQVNIQLTGRKWADFVVVTALVFK